MCVGVPEGKRKEMKEQELNEMSLQFCFGPIGPEAGYGGGEVRAGTKRALPAAGTQPCSGEELREKGGT